MLSRVLSSLPELPPRFGNPLLRGDLAEIESIGSIDWLPQTAGWAVVALAVSGWLSWHGWALGRRWFRNRYRREALTRLTAIKSRPNLEAINALLKLTAIAASSRKEVASLTGTRWCLWLQERTPTPLFSDDTLTLLGESLYAPVDQDKKSADPTRQADNTDFGSLSTLFAEAEGWIREHRDDHAPT
jgi:hypothetical protein